MIRGPCVLVIQLATPRRERQLDEEIQELSKRLRHTWAHRRRAQARATCRLILRQLRSAYTLWANLSDEPQYVRISLKHGHTLSEAKKRKIRPIIMGESRSWAAMWWSKYHTACRAWDDRHALEIPAYSGVAARQFWNWLELWRAGLVD